MSTPGERITALERDHENMKDRMDEFKIDQDRQWAHLGVQGKYIYIGVGISVAINAIAMIWVAFYHH